MQCIYGQGFSVPESSAWAGGFSIGFIPLSLAPRTEPGTEKASKYLEWMIELIRFYHVLVSFPPCENKNNQGLQFKGGVVYLAYNLKEGSLFGSHFQRFQFMVHWLQSEISWQKGMMKQGCLVHHSQKAKHRRPPRRDRKHPQWPTSSNWAPPPKSIVSYKH